MDTLQTRILALIDTHSKLDIIFKNNDKVSDIKDNKYLSYCLEQLKNISGNIFLYGVSMNKNDSHIWNAIKKNSNIENIYISVLPRERDELTKNTKEAFGSRKGVVFFNSHLKY